MVRRDIQYASQNLCIQNVFKTKTICLLHVKQKLFTLLEVFLFTFQMRVQNIQGNHAFTLFIFRAGCIKMLNRLATEYISALIVYNLVLSFEELLNHSEHYKAHKFGRGSDIVLRRSGQSVQFCLWGL